MCLFIFFEWGGGGDSGGFGLVALVFFGGEVEEYSKKKRVVVLHSVPLECGENSKEQDKATRQGTVATGSATVVALQYVQHLVF